MKATVEREIKLGLAPGRPAPALPGTPAPVRHLSSTYWDTAGRGLAHAGLTLRHRVENGRGRWQLKIPHGDARLELEADGGGAIVPADLAALLAAFTRTEPLERAALLVTRRSGTCVTAADGTPLAEVVIDEVTVQDGARVVDSFAEIEVELLPAGGELDLARIAKLLRAAGASDGDGRPKLLRVLGVEEPALAGGLDGLAATQARFALAFAAQHRTLLSRDPGTRLGTDPEDLHDMRVATRRLRSYLRAARSLVEPAWAERLRSELGWLADVLGEVRDLDVQLVHLTPAVATLDPAEAEALGASLVARLAAEHGRKRERLLVALGSSRYHALLDLLDEPVAFAGWPVLPAPAEDAAGAAAAEPAPPATAPLAAPTLEQIAAAELRKLRRAMRDIDAASPDDALHAARIRGKRARYAAELALGPAATKRSPLVARVKALQDVLGEHQDAVVSEECIRRFAGRSRSALLGAGRLVERERVRRAEARAALPATRAALDKAARKARRSA